MPVAMIPIRIRHDLERFYFCVNMLNYNPLAGKPFVISLFLFGQPVFLACLYRYPAVRMQFLQPLIPAARVYRD
jgi:hypothetical protein